MFQMFIFPNAARSNCPLHLNSPENLNYSVQLDNSRNLATFRLLTEIEMIN